MKWNKNKMNTVTAIRPAQVLEHTICIYSSLYYTVFAVSAQEIYVLNR